MHVPQHHAVPVVATQPRLLSLTGSNAARYVAIALGLLVAGAVLTVAGRRRRAAGFGR